MPKNDQLKVLLLENIHANAKNKFEQYGLKVDCIDGALPPDDLANKLKDYHVLGIRSKTKITSDLINANPQLLAVGAYCIGTNQLDVINCTKEGILISNAPYSSTRSVVELAIGEIIALSRSIFAKSLKLHKGIWHKSVGFAAEIRGKTLGIIGYGNIGSQLSILAENLGLNVIYYDKQVKMPLGNAKSKSSMQDVLRESDYVSLHVDGCSSNTNLIGANELSIMKEGAMLINLSRGHVVDISALKDALTSGHLSGAAVDVYPEEPEKKHTEFKCCLSGLDNVILTPHIGGSTVEAQEDIGDFVTERLIDYIDSGSTALSINLPHLAVSGKHNKSRFLHIHQNVPGVLASINDVCRNHKLNIVSQQLKTNEAVGISITDVDAITSNDFMNELKTVSGTIRIRDI